MILHFPDDHDLVAFFEAEPLVVDPSIPWFYNTLTFATARGPIDIVCAMTPSYGDLQVALKMNGADLATIQLTGAESIEVVVIPGRESLIVSFPDGMKLDPFVLQLRPEVWVAWGNSRYS